MENKSEFGGQDVSDDEFGDFCAQPSIPEPVIQHPVKCQPNYDIDLEIDSCLSWSGPSIDTNQQEPEAIAVKEEDEEFSQFTSAEEPVAAIDLLDSLEPTCSLPPPVSNVHYSLTSNMESLVIQATSEDDFGDFEQATAVVVPVVEKVEIVQEEVKEIESVHILNEIIEPEPVVDADDDDFGDFTDFQAAADDIEPQQEEVEDEFDDFEVAPPPAAALAGVQEEETNQLTPEVRLQRLLNGIFPYKEPVEAGTTSPEKSLNSLSPLSSRGALWSYVSQLDSTPALSFQWRHSTAHQRFLNSLKIDTIQQQVNNLKS